jgi:cytochrome c oxidase subunit 1
MSTTTAPARPQSSTLPFGASKVERKGNILVRWITSTDHKVIGYLYLITAFIYFCVGGVMALIIRAQLFEPGLELIQTREQYNQLFTMHGTIMLLLFATSVRSSQWPGSSPLRAPRPSDGSPINHSRRRRSRPASAATCGCSVSVSPASARSSVR